MSKPKIRQCLIFRTFILFIEESWDGSLLHRLLRSSPLSSNKIMYIQLFAYFPHFLLVRENNPELTARRWLYFEFHPWTMVGGGA